MQDSNNLEEGAILPTGAKAAAELMMATKEMSAYIVFIFVGKWLYAFTDNVCELAAST